MTKHSRDSGTTDFNSSESGSGRSYSLEEDGANGSDTVDLSWLDIAFVDLPYAIHIKKAIKSYECE